MPNLDLAQIDQLLTSLTSVVRARVRMADSRDSLSEIHILSDGAIPPKQIVRNIETLLKTAFDLPIDHRIVSIAVLKDGAELETDEAERNGTPAERSPESQVVTIVPRVVFQSLRVVQEEPLKCTAYVELKLGDIIFEGHHRDTDTPKARLYASARAVIEALEYLTQKEMAFYLAGLELLHVFQRDVLVVLIEGRQQLQQVRMLGTSVVDEDPSEAAVRAVLDAVNRFITRPNGKSTPAGSFLRAG
ncbi:MAG: hypothetical protein ABR559_03870 [Gemmatimonadota bacterium]